MDEIIAKLVESVGLEQETAAKVAEFIKDNLDDLPKWLAKAGIADQLPGGLGKLL